MPNILIVDDQPCIRELLSEELICEGYRVASTGDAESVCLDELKQKINVKRTAGIRAGIKG